MLLLLIIAYLNTPFNASAIESSNELAEKKTIESISKKWKEAQPISKGSPYKVKASFTAPYVVGY